MLGGPEFSKAGAKWLNSNYKDLKIEDSFKIIYMMVEKIKW